MSKHRVTTHSWENGILKNIGQVFDTLADAMSFAKRADAHSVKIYDADGSLVHSAHNVNPEVLTKTYA